MRVVPDTSVWVDYLRTGIAGPAGALEQMLDAGEVLICGPVVAELLTGARPDQLDDLWLALGSLPWAELDHAAWRLVGEVANDLRRTGHTVAFTDVAIGVAAARAGGDLWTRDEDLFGVAAVCPGLGLELYESE